MLASVGQRSRGGFCLSAVLRFVATDASTKHLETQRILTAVIIVGCRQSLLTVS